MNEGELGAVRAAQEKLATLQGQTDAARAERDELIADLLADGVRASDVAHIIGMSRAAVSKIGRAG